jgi:hypothetical protein
MKEINHLYLLPHTHKFRAIIKQQKQKYKTKEVVEWVCKSGVAGGRIMLTDILLTFRRQNFLLNLKCE